MKLSRKTVALNIKKLKDLNYIERVGSDKKVIGRSISIYKMNRIFFKNI